MKTGEAENWLRQQLLSVYDASEAANIASLVMEHLTGLPRADRLLQKEEPLNVHQLHHLTEFNQRLQHHEPVQYVLGETWFYGLKLFVEKNVLVPRPETEELVHWIVQDVKASGKDVFERGPYEADKTNSFKILDVGTGSGCIALALKKTMPAAEVWGCDSSEAALNIARRNASELDVRVDFVALDFLSEPEQAQLPSFEIIVSNPPYIPIKEKEELQNNVTRYEPHGALFVPDDDALVFYKALAQFGHRHLNKDGRVYVEIHEHYGNEVVHLFKSEGYSQVELRKDMQGKDRMVSAAKS